MAGVAPCRRWPVLGYAVPCEIWKTETNASSPANWVVLYDGKLIPNCRFDSYVRWAVQNVNHPSVLRASCGAKFGLVQRKEDFRNAIGVRTWVYGDSKDALVEVELETLEIKLQSTLLKISWVKKDKSRCFLLHPGWFLEGDSGQRPPEGPRRKNSSPGGGHLYTQSVGLLRFRDDHPLFGVWWRRDVCREKRMVAFGLLL